MSAVKELERLMERYPVLEGCREDIKKAFEIMKKTYENGGQLLVCGNGGSGADSEHIVGELMKEFGIKRPLPESEKEKLLAASPENGELLGKHLQGSLPAIPLTGNIALSTAFANDAVPELVFAQQVYGYGTPESVLVGISTSGNSKNVIYALDVAKAKKMATIGMTGESGGKMKELCDVCICVPSTCTPDIQEFHLPVYHCLCRMIEEEFFRMKYLAGIDIGGTKCAVTIGKVEGENIEVLYKEKFPTPGEPLDAVGKLVDTLKAMVEAHPEAAPAAIGVSCGGPLDSEKGLILCPPNLPNWDRIDVVTPFTESFGVPCAVQNDANACALAEWLWGAGKGTRNMIFLTFGTGLGAGLILDGKLYCGTNDMAGEVGHVRLAECGPEGYGKRGSFEGFCSGGGIARYGIPKIAAWIAQGKQTAILNRGQEIEEVTTQDIGLSAQAGDELALSILQDTGRMLGKGVAMLMDILNPERIVIGSVFLRQEAILRDPMEEVIAKEALSYTREVCRVVPAGLGEQLGDFAALSVAGNLLQ